MDLRGRLQRGKVPALRNDTLPCPSGSNDSPCRPPPRGIGAVASLGQQDIRGEEVAMHHSPFRRLGRTCPLIRLGKGDVGRV